MSTEQNEYIEDTDTDTDTEQYEDISSIDPLYSAALTGNVTEVRRLLEAKASPDTPGNSEEDTPLHGASKKHHIEVMRVLLAAKADPNPANLSGETPIHLAAGSSKKDALQTVIELFISKASLLAATKIRELTPLDYATGEIRGDNRPAYNFIEWINSCMKKDAKDKNLTEMPDFLRKEKVAEYKLVEQTILRRKQLTHQLKSAGLLKKLHEFIPTPALDPARPRQSSAERKITAEIATLELKLAQLRRTQKNRADAAALLTSSSAFLPPPSKKRKPEAEAAPNLPATQRRHTQTDSPSRDATPDDRISTACYAESML